MPLYIGLMSGTSADAVDAAMVELSSDVVKLIACHSEAIPRSLKEALRTAISNESLDRSIVWQLDTRVGELFARAAQTLIENAGITRSRIHAIGSHGQTIFHDPDAEFPCTVQIGDPNVIVERTGITTVADLRRRDLAAGGQGAPLAPAFHHAVFRSPTADRAVVNIGGIANVTVLPADDSKPVIGFDTGPGNTLMDAWIQSERGESMDTNSAWAATGSCNADLLGSLRSDAYFDASPPKSTGRELFNLRWVQKHLAEVSAAIAPEDIQNTLCELTANTIASAIRTHASDTREVLVCGGGAHNPLLLSRLENHLEPLSVRSTLSLGIDPDWVEAMAFAWLAARTLAGKAGNLPEVTGAKHPVVLGGIYPGRQDSDNG